METSHRQHSRWGSGVAIAIAVLFGIYFFFPVVLFAPLLHSTSEWAISIAGTTLWPLDKLYWACPLYAELLDKEAEWMGFGRMQATQQAPP